MNYKKLLQQAVDFHVHIGPEIIPRKYTVSELIKSQKNKLKAIAIKNHFFPTMSMTPAKLKKSADTFIINSVVLNNYVGGLNPEIIRASAALSSLPIVVWLPTINAKNSLQQQNYEIPSEWISKDLQNKIKARKSSTIQGLSVLDQDGQLIKAANQVLQAIKDCNAILATGHLSWKESQALVTNAVEIFNIKKIIVTHPIYQKIKMPLSTQKKLSTMGAFMEQSFSMYSIDKIPIKKIAKQIRFVGADRCIVSSDVGQTFSPSPDKALIQFIKLLKSEGITDQELKTMLVTNTNALLG